MALTRPILTAVLTQDTESMRFESFSIAILSTLENVVVVPTSISWDLGRDGRTVGPGSRVLACTSLRDDVEAKTLEDLKRIAENIKPPAKIYFCSSQALSEHRLNEIEKELRKALPEKFELQMLGATQLIELALRFEGTAERFYRAEIDDIIRALSEDDAGDEEGSAEHVGLRLALMTAGHESSGAIREAVYKVSTLNVLEAGPKAIGGICRDIAGFLKLAQSIDDEAIQPHLDALDRDGFIKRAGELYSITDEGRKSLEEHRAQAPKKLMEGRAAVRVQLEKSLGQKLADEQFAEIWQILQNKLAVMFYERGLRLLEEVADLIGVEVEGGVAEGKPSPDFVKILATAVGETSALPDQKKELAVAIQDIFSERTGHAADWLVSVCAGFVIACSLGLESMCKEAIQKIAARTTLVFDTDVVLSLLGEGEPDHEVATSIRRKWKALGGKMMVADSVVHEVSYHASIAQNDYDAVSRWLPGDPEERLRLIENAFVRSYATLLAQGKAKRTHWPQFIRQYASNVRGELTKISGLLSELNIGKLPARAASEKLLEDNARNFLFEKVDRASMDNRDRKNSKDKARRDAAMYAAMVSFLKAIKGVDASASCLLVSSARRLMELESKFRQAEEDHFVVTPAIVVYLLSLMPDVSLGMSALKGFLFDETRFGVSNSLERTLLRVIHDSREMSIPWARRTTLMRQLRAKMFDRAKQEGVAPADRKLAVAKMEAQVPNPKYRMQTVELLKEALDGAAADSRQADEVARLHQKVLLLEAENARLKAAKRGER